LSHNKYLEPQESPCVRNCCLDSEDVCLGCFRHIDEIVAWRSYNQQKKQQIIARCQQRRDSHDEKFKG